MNLIYKDCAKFIDTSVFIECSLLLAPAPTFFFNPSLSVYHILIYLSVTDKLI